MTEISNKVWTIYQLSAAEPEHLLRLLCEENRRLADDHERMRLISVEARRDCEAALRDCHRLRVAEAALTRELAVRREWEREARALLAAAAHALRSYVYGNDASRIDTINER